MLRHPQIERLEILRSNACKIREDMLSILVERPFSVTLEQYSPLSYRRLVYDMLDNVSVSRTYRLVPESFRAHLSKANTTFLDILLSYALSIKSYTAFRCYCLGARESRFLFAVRYWKRIM